MGGGCDWECGAGRRGIPERNRPEKANAQTILTFEFQALTAKSRRSDVMRTADIELEDTDCVPFPNTLAVYLVTFSTILLRVL